MEKNKFKIVITLLFILVVTIGLAISYRSAYLQTLEIGENYLDVFNTKEHRQLLIFPEGGILKTDDEIGKRIRKGAIFVAAKMKLPIIPVYITRRPKLFSKVNVIFGKPFYVEQEILSDKEKLKNKSKELIDIIYKLKI